MLANNLAALPPGAQKAREEQAILEDPRLLEILGPRSVEQLRERAPGYALIPERDGYTLLAEGVRIRVYVAYLPREDALLGPAPFELYFVVGVL